MTSTGTASAFIGNGIHAYFVSTYHSNELFFEKGPNKPQTPSLYIASASQSQLVTISHPAFVPLITQKDMAGDRSAYLSD
ncbi:MAG: hypothetical protein L6R39_006071 [Caloplaca ligustica]|nr:MAG: hypothetical protein L6R39_006071 [Caloplaca ligustica]